MFSKILFFFFSALLLNLNVASASLNKTLITKLNCTVGYGETLEDRENILNYLSRQNCVPHDWEISCIRGGNTQPEYSGHLEFYYDYCEGNQSHK